MTDTEKEEFKQMFERLYAKTIEVHALLKDGKVVVAYEKLGGIIKVIQQLGNKVVNEEKSSN